MAEFVELAEQVIGAAINVHRELGPKRLELEFHAPTVKDGIRRKSL